MFWIPPLAGRDARTLRAYVDSLYARVADSPAGAGAATIVPWDLAASQVERALHPDLDYMVRMLVFRSRFAWGAFHARRAPVGNRATKWCHPHFLWAGNRSVAVSYNGVSRLAEREGAPLWSKAQADGLTEVNPLLVPTMIRQYGLDTCVELGLPNTVIAYTFEDDADQSRWTIRCCWRLERFPLYHLRNGGVASVGGEGEFEAVDRLPPGIHVLATEEA